MENIYLFVWFGKEVRDISLWLGSISCTLLGLMTWLVNATGSRWDMRLTDSEWENHEILPNYSEFDLFMFVFSISNNLCLAQQLLNTTLVSSLPCFLFISARRRPLVAELGWVQVRFSDTNNCLRLPGPQGSRAATEPSQPSGCDVFVCFCFYPSWAL